MSDAQERGRATGIFAGLDEADRNLLMSLAETRHVAEGQLIFAEGDAGDAMYVIASGQVLVGKGKGLRPGQYDRILATLGPGDVVGEMALLLDAPRTAAARAVTPVVLERISRDSFEGLVAGNDRVATTLYRNLARGLAGKIRQIDEGLVSLHQRARQSGLGPDDLAAAHESLFSRGFVI